VRCWRRCFRGRSAHGDTVPLNNPLPFLGRDLYLTTPDRYALIYLYCAPRRRSSRVAHYGALDLLSGGTGGSGQHCRGRWARAQSSWKSSAAARSIRSTMRSYSSPSAQC